MCVAATGTTTVGCPVICECLASYQVNDCCVGLRHTECGAKRSSLPERDKLSIADLSLRGPPGPVESLGGPGGHDGSVSAKGYEEAQVDPDVMSLRFDGIELAFIERSPGAAHPDYPSVLGDRQRAAVELGRLAASGEIYRYPESSYPQDLCVCPSHLIAKEDKVRVVRDWSDVLYPLNSCLSNPPAQYGAMDDFLRTWEV